MKDEDVAAGVFRPGESISVGTLQKEIGNSAAKSAMKSLDTLRIPNHQDLKLGDVILSRSPGQSGMPVDIVGEQKKLGCYSDEACTWEHAALYVGNLHVIESRPLDLKHLKSGLVLNPLSLKTTDRKERLILRHKDQNFAEKRFEVARHALLDFHLDRRHYAYFSVLHTALYNFSPRWLNLQTVLGKMMPEISRAATCSEYILDTYTAAAQALIRQHVDYISDPSARKPFVPASLYNIAEFEKIPLVYYELLES